MDENQILKCDFCDECFYKEEILSTHVLSIHESIIEGKMKCEFCDKTLSSKNSLYEHVKMRHISGVVCFASTDYEANW